MRVIDASSAGKSPDFEGQDMRKTLFTLGFMMLVALAAGLYFVMFRLDSVIESRVEKAATAAFGTKVKVTGVKTDLRDGTLTVDQISVANPPGYESPFAARLNSVQATVDYDDLEIRQLVIRNPEFYVEEHNGKTNFGQMLQALNSGSQSAASNDTGKAEPVIAIRHLRIDETQAAFSSQTFDRYTDMQVDAIEMNNLRGTPTELARQIAGKVVSELSEETASELFKAKAQKKVDEIQKKVKDKLQELLGGDDDGNDQS